MTIYDPLNTVNGVPQPFPGNLIPQDRIDPVARNLMQYMVSPNSIAGRRRQQLLPARELAVRHLHLGHHPHRSQLLRQPSLLRPLRPQRPARDPRQGRARGDRADRRLPPPLEQRAERRPELDADAEPAVEPARGLDAAPPARHQRRRGSWAASTRPILGFPSLFTSQIPPRFVPIRIDDYGGASIGQGGGQDGPSDDFYVQETLTKVLGRHQLKFGGEFRYGVSDVENPLAGTNFVGLLVHAATSPRCGRTSATSPSPTAATRSRRTCSATWRRTPSRAARSSTGAAPTAARSCRTTGGSRAASR